jgi:dipeptidyl aminopeptidase/acylaminoacyl peptidase
MKTLSLFVCLSGLAGLLSAQNNTPNHPGRLLQVDDFSRFEDVADPELSPDGQWVLYTVTTLDEPSQKRQSDIWQVKWDGSQKLRLTSSPDSESSPRWSPDGKYISFLSGRGGGPAKGSQVWVLDRQGGEAHQLTELKERISSYAWSPDSKRLVLVAREGEGGGGGRGARQAAPETPANADKPWVIDRYHFKQDIQGYLTGDANTHILLYDIQSKKAEALTGDKDHDEENPAWSPDGAKIAFVSNREHEFDRTHNTDVFVADAKPGSTARQLTSSPAPDGGRLAWSPDSTTIAFVEGTGDVRYAFHSLNRLGVVSVNGGAPKLLNEKLDRGVSSPVFSADGKFVSFLVADDRTEYPARVPVAGGETERLLSGPRVIQSVTYSAGHTAALVATDTDTAQVFAVEGKELRKLTFNNSDLLEQVRLGKTEDINFKSKDGTEVHALLTTPPDYVAGKRYPILVRIHGGPTAQDAHSFQFERQLFAANGYVVLSVNYRGSAGRGEQWSRAIYQDWGHKDVEDVLAATDYAVAQGIADPERLGIGGWSYGGVLTDYTIAHDTRFKAAISGAGSANHISLYGHDQYVYLYDTEFGPPWKNPDLWIKFSYPFFHADQIKTPTLFMGGEKDFNVPIIGGEQMYQALKNLNVPTELVVYPGQNHGFTKPSFIRDRYERYLAWYAKYLKPGETPVSRASR